MTDDSGQPARRASSEGRQEAGAAPALVGCIVLTWNNHDDTDECLRYLQALTYPNVRTIVVNNGSTDGSIDRLKASWGDQATFIDNASNDSIPAGYNLGFAEALRLGCDYVCQVDNDVVVEPGFVEALLGAFAGNEDLALAAPIMLDYYRPDRVWFAGARYIRALGLTYYRHMGRPLATLQKLNEVSRTDLAPTCAVMVSRRALEQVGVLDERLAFSHDDVDWCLRAASLGFRSVVVNRPLARHKISLTRGNKGTHVEGPRAAHDMAMASYLVGQKYLRGLDWLPFLAGRLALSLPYQVVRMARAGAWASARAYLRGTIDGLASTFSRRRAGDATPGLEQRLTE